MGTSQLTAANDPANVSQTTDQKGPGTVAFSLPEPVNPDGWLTDYDGLFYDDQNDFWEPPIDRQLLAAMPRRNAAHGAIIQGRANMAASRYQGGGMSHQQLTGGLINHITFGDVAILKIRDHFGRVVRLFPLPSYRTRVTLDGGAAVLEREDQIRRYPAKDVVWVKKYDPVQQVYGCPDYLGGMQSALLNEDATLFRRKYFLNGAHMGFIMYATDPNMDIATEEMLQQKIQDSKGVGNFRSLFVNIPGGKEKGIQIIPVGNFESKDEFMNVKNVSAQDVLTAHRYPPGLAGIIATNTAGLGNPLAYDSVYFRNETKPLILELRDAVARDPEIPKALHLQFDLEDASQPE